MELLKTYCNFKNANPRIMKAIYCATVLPILLYCSETWNITTRIKQMLEVFHHKVARELNRQKFLKFWKRRYGSRTVVWSKVRQSNHLALAHINLKTLGEYWENRTRSFRENYQEMESFGYVGKIRNLLW